MVDLDLRLVRYFTVVAAHQQVSRAATELRIAQPSLSRQITALEKQVGTRLFDRTRQGARLTAAGAAFLPHALRLLDGSARGVADAVNAARPDRLVVGYTTGLVVTPAVRRLRDVHPAARVEILHLDWDQPREALLDRRVDCVITRRPLRGDGLEVSPLHDEPRVLLVASSHRLADRASVDLGDLRDEAVPRFGDAAFDAFWRIAPRPDGSVPEGPLVHTIQDKVELVASGEAVAIIPEAAGATGLRADLRTVPLRDVAPAQVVVATRAGDHRVLVDEFRTAVAAGSTPDGPDRGRSRA